MHTNGDVRELLRARAPGVVSSMLWALMASAMLVESDVYRYVTIALVAFALIWHGAEVRRVSRDWLAIVCYSWSAYVFIRFASGVLISGEKGTSEWLYIFPIFFPLMGAALFVSRRSMFQAASLLVACGLICLLFTVRIPAIFEGERAAPLFHHNPIHAGIGCSMLFLTATFWLLHAAETGRLTGRFKWTIFALGTATAFLSLVGVLGSQSKGAWLALAATIVFIGALSLFRLTGRRRMYCLCGLLLTAVVAATIAFPYVEHVAGTTMDAAVRLTGDTVTTEAPLSAMERAIADPVTPNAMRERLMLWSNAIELIQAAPWVGWGNGWLREWSQTTHAAVGYKLIHNGYLEIMVRHGLLGIVFLLVFVIAAARSVYAAKRCGLISESVAVYLYGISFFFLCTIATNSNNRLALGESFFIVTAAAVFALRLAVRKVQHDRAFAVTGSSAVQ